MDKICDEAQPLVSVVIPVYNAEPFLDELFTSLANQTMKNFVAVIVNDGSTDNSETIIKRWVAKDSRFLSLHQSNKGLSATRNRALDFIDSLEVQTSYLMFIDADDMLAPNALERLYSKANSDNLDDLIFTSEVFYSSKEMEAKFGHYSEYYKRNSEYLSIYTGLDYLSEALGKGDYRPSACLQFFRSQFIFANGIRFYEGIIHEDNLFTLKCMTFANRVAFLNEELYIRRVREDSIMTSGISWKNTDGYFRCGIESIKLLCEVESELSNKHKESLLSIIRSFFNQALETFLQINEGERRELDNRYSNSGKLAEQALFEAVIRLPSDRLTNQKSNHDVSLKNLIKNSVHGVLKRFQS